MQPKSSPGQQRASPGQAAPEANSSARIERRDKQSCNEIENRVGNVQTGRGVGPQQQAAGSDRERRASFGLEARGAQVVNGCGSVESGLEENATRVTQANGAQEPRSENNNDDERRDDRRQVNADKTRRQPHSRPVVGLGLNVSGGSGGARSTNDARCERPSSDERPQAEVGAGLEAARFNQRIVCVASDRVDAADCALGARSRQIGSGVQTAASGQQTDVRQRQRSERASSERQKFPINDEFDLRLAEENESQQNRIYRQSSAPANEQQKQTPQVRQQRIKVTLSRPRSDLQQNPGDLRQEAAAGENLPAEVCEPAAVSSRLSGSSSQVNFGALEETPRTRGQSTATLISGSIEQIAIAADINTPTRHNRPTSDSTNEQLSDNSLGACDRAAGGGAGVRKPPLGRSEQESRLRRIASQRRPTCNSTHQGQQQQEPAKGTGARRQSPGVAQTNSEKRNFLLSTPASSSVRQQPEVNTFQNNNQSANQTKGQPQQSQTQDLAPSKQLAIYINGKIRSNSIFCSRSASSNSFTGILKSHFRSNSRTSTTTNATVGQQGAKQASRRSSSERNDHCDSTAAGKGNFVNCLIPSVCERKSAGARGRLSLSRGRKSQTGRWPSRWRRRRPGWLREGTLNCCAFVNRHAVRPGPRGHVGLESDGQEGGRVTSKQEGVGGSEQLCEAENQLKATQDQDRASGQEQEVKTYKLNPSSMFLRKAMRYYRLWIYSTNLIIFLGTLVFFLAALYVGSDYRFQLVVAPAALNPPPTPIVLADAPSSFEQSQVKSSISSSNNETAAALAESLSMERHSFSIEWTEPVMLLAYLMIAVQLGLLQALGFFGAIRMKERLIQAFWYLILGLVLIDVMLFVYWLQRYDVMLNTLRDEMTARLNKQYGAGPRGARSRALAENGQLEAEGTPPTVWITSEMDYDKTFTEILDRIQATSHCCGISSLLDYKRTQWRNEKLVELRTKLAERDSELTGGRDGIDRLLGQLPLVPASCCVVPGRALDERDGETHQNGAGNLSGPPRSKSAMEPADNDGEWSASGAGQPTLAEVIDRRWSGRGLEHNPPQAEGDSSAPSGITHFSPGSQPYGWDSKKRARLRNKQVHHDRLPDGGHQQANGLGPSRFRRALSSDDDVEQDGGERPQRSASGEEDETEQQDEADQIDEADYDVERAEADAITVETKLRPKAGRDKDDAGRPGEILMGARDGELEWVVETKLDQRGRVVSRLVEAIASASQVGRSGEQSPGSKSSGTLNQVGGRKRSGGSAAYEEPAAQTNELSSSAKLSRLRALLFGSQANNHKSSLNGTKLSQWPSKLGLNLGQFKLIESYLSEGLLPAAATTPPTSTQTARPKLSRRSIWSSLVSASQSDNNQTLGQQKPQDGNQTTSGRTSESAEASVRSRRLALVRELVTSDAELSCLARSHFDTATIYTRGCQPQIRAWLQSSANILFIMGFCVLTVLKFCSLILLRLELREMIHKIRVLRGMATEYNALQDLEPYLPRPSLCAQAADLTPAGVLGPALGSPSGGGGAGSSLIAGASNEAAISCDSTQNHQAHRTSSYGSTSGPMVAPRRLGGSFSEAVAAATAVAHQQRLAEQQQQHLERHLRDYERAASLVNCARASSKNMLGGPSCSCNQLNGSGASNNSTLTAPRGLNCSSLCPFSTSSISMAAQQHQDQQLTGNFRSDLFPAGFTSMPRRHTAVSVCPAAAAAAAAAAAHHLMMRRGTFAIANPFNFSTSQPQHCQSPSGGLSALSAACVAAARQPSSSMLQAKSLNHLNQHRHSAHTILPGHLLFGQQGGEASGGLAGLATNFLLPTASGKLSPYRRPSNLLKPVDSLAGQQRPRKSSNQLNPAQNPPFKRQTSGGAQSAVNFSLDIAPVQLTESRRSIH